MSSVADAPSAPAESAATSGDPPTEIRGPEQPLPPVATESGSSTPAWPTALGRRRRPLAWGAGLLIVLLVLLPAGTWLRYQAAHVTSTNALVRAHLSEIGTRLDGVVASVEVDAGDRVTAGQVLVRLDDRPFHAQAEEMRAEVLGLERSIEVERLAIEHDRRRIAQQQEEAVARVAAAEAQVAAAAIRADDARAQLDLRRSLLEGNGAVSSEDVRSATTDWRTAQALLNEARAKLAASTSAEEKARLVGEALAVRERKVGILEADLRRAEAGLLRADADLEAAWLRAPADGAIVRRIMQPGASVKTGQPIISMWFGDDVWVEAWVDENDIAAVGLGSPATVRLHAFPGREFTGVVDKLGLATDYEMPASEVPQPRYARRRGTPVVGVRIQLEAPPAELLPGLSAVVAIRRSGG